MSGARFSLDPLPNPGAGTPYARENYLRQQIRRFVETVQLCLELCPDPSCAVLDVGRSNLSSRLLEHYASVTTLGLSLEITGNYAHTTGWEPPAGRRYAGHICCDLNRVPTHGASEYEGRFDLIVFAEVIEHLYASPYAALAWLGYLLKDGGLILCTTPNAASLSRRRRLLVGDNPAEPLRYDLNNPGHVHEYTRRELYELGPLAKLDILLHRYADYRDMRGPRSVASRLLGRIFPALAPDQVIVFKKRGLDPARDGLEPLIQR